MSVTVTHSYRNRSQTKIIFDLDQTFQVHGRLATS
jgi:hypothetical protein